MIKNKLDRVALTWLNNNFGNLKPIVKEDETYYVNEDRLPLFYYYQDKKNRYVYINYNEIWSFFESFFGMEYTQIQGVIRDWLEETYNLKGLTPQYNYSNLHKQLEETYNLKGLTPLPFINYPLMKLEETYNLKGLTPCTGTYTATVTLEETYNLKGLTPDI
jgi:hypothetical protein